jgi:predicted unusual protein kinase regulating ubiquinone biosynthesis (AarF/ABC1/UbiB family)
MSDDRNDAKTHGPVSKGQRFFRLAGMTAAVAGEYAKSQLKTAFKGAEEIAKERAASHSRTGERIAQTLGELKGAAMKVGQMASIGSDLLPKELSDALVKLQKEAPPMPYSVIASQIERELGAPPETLFRRFDPKPFAAASIGQVHRAQTDDGREVVVKVQYPGVDDSVDSDLAHLKVALRASGLVKVDRKALNALFDELRARLREELDYCNEADNVRYFKQFHKKHPFIVIPDVVGERSSQRVLTLIYEPGDHIRDLDAKGYTQELRDKIGYNLFHLLGSQIFDLKAVHADPNPANMAVRPNGDIVLYDFGCVKRIPPTVIRDYRRLIVAAMEDRWADVDRHLIELGARNPAFEALPGSFYKPWRDLFLTPYYGEQPYSFGSSNLHQEAMRLIPEFLQIVSRFTPPVELVFIDRAALGHYGNLKTIRSRCDLLPHLRHYLDLAAESA